MAVFKVKFWGVRGSYPTPGESTIKYGGNTTCVEIETDIGLLIIDSGTGIINLGKKIVKEKKYKTISILFTHTHKDHTEGFPSFLPSFLGDYRINIYGPKFLDKGIDDIIANTMNFSYFPVTFEETGSLKSALNIQETDVIIMRPDRQLGIVYNRYHANYKYDKDRDIIIRLMRSYNHPRNGVYIYRIEYKGKSFVFATDVESYAEGDYKLINFAKNADVLVHDAAYSNEIYRKKQGWGHSTPEMAAENASKSSSKRLYLTHHDPEDSEKDIEDKLEEAKKIFSNSYIAYENLEIDMMKL